MESNTITKCKNSYLMDSFFKIKYFNFFLNVVENPQYE